MDPVTHSVVGIGLYSLLSNDFSINDPALISITIGSVAPDLDILYRLRGELSYLRGHRGFSHGIPGLFFISGIFSIAISLFFTDFFALQSLFWVFCGAVSHTFLDLLNTHGVKLFSPFTNKTYSFNLLLIYDPFLILFFMFMIVIRYYDYIHLINIPLFLIVSYLFFRFYTNNSIKKFLALKYSKHKIVNVTVMPSLLSLFSWNFIIEKQDSYILGQLKTYPKGLNLIRELTKKNNNYFVNKALNSKLGRIFKDFTPHFHIESYKKDGHHYVEFLDLRYILGSSFLHSATAVYDNNLELQKSTFHPFSKNRRIKIEG